MSKTLRTPRAKSSGIRSLGSVRLQHGVSSSAFPVRNDPALHINQLSPPTPLPSGTNHAHDLAKEREFQEKERKLKDHISSLEKLIAQLRAELKQKTESCRNLQKTLDAKVQEHEEAMSCCEKEHNITREALQVSQNKESELKCLLESTKQSYEDKIQEIIKEYEKKMEELRIQKDKELQEKDKKLEILKQRMAESLGKNSMERQQQLEELKRDLVKHAQEARDLQQKLKHFQLRSKQCDNCEKLQAQLDEKILQVRLKEKTINDLQGIGRKMHAQLEQQDILLRKWEERERREDAK